MSVQCISCQKFSFKECGSEFPKLGYGNCSLDAKFVMYGAMRHRDCGTFDVADADVVDKRKSWLQERRK